MKLRIYTDEWFINMGIVGFYNLYKFVGKEDEIDIHNNYIEFDSEILENFSDYYFKYFLNKYNKAETEMKILKKNLHFLKNAKDDSSFEKQIKWQKDRVESYLDKLKNKKKYKLGFEKEGEELNRIFNAMEEIKKKGQFNDFLLLIDDFEKVINLDKVNEKLSLSCSKWILSSYFGQAMFLQVRYNNLSLSEHKTTLEENIIEPLMNMDRLKKQLKNSKNINELKFFINEEIKKDICKTYIKFLKKLKGKDSLDDVNDYIKNEVLSGSFLTDEISLSQFTNKSTDDFDFTQKIFYPLASSIKNSLNLYWNGNNKFPISCLTRMILFCTPIAGVEMKNGLNIENKAGIITKNFGFVNLDTSVSDLINKNKLLTQDINDENPFNDFVYNLVNELEDKKKLILGNIEFVEFNSSYKARRSKINAFGFSQTVIDYLKEYGISDLIKIKDKKFKKYVIQLLITNKTIKDKYQLKGETKVTSVIFNDFNKLIDHKLRELLKGKREHLNSVLSSIVIHTKLKDIGRGNYKMKKNSKKVYLIYKEGKKIQKFIPNHKIDGFVYKLLNSINGGRKFDFLDILLRLYAQCDDLKLPNLFLDVTNEENLDFKTIGYSFVIGLMGDDYQKKDKNSLKIKTKGELK